MVSKSTQFELLGYNHVALVCADMQKTVDFYEGILGFPLVKTLEYAGGNGQHFFFQVTEDDGVAFFWFADAPAAAPGIASAPWQFTDEQGRPTGGIAWSQMKTCGLLFPNGTANNAPARFDESIAISA